MPMRQAQPTWQGCSCGGVGWAAQHAITLCRPCLFSHTTLTCHNLPSRLQPCDVIIFRFLKSEINICVELMRRHNATCGDSRGRLLRRFLSVCAHSLFMCWLKLYVVFHLSKALICGSNVHLICGNRNFAFMAPTFYWMNLKTKKLFAFKDAAKMLSSVNALMGLALCHLKWRHSVFECDFNKAMLSLKW